MSISIIIPTLNEEARIGNRQELSLLQASALCEVIIVDGGSTDQTTALARSQGFRVENSPPGRGRQLNCGAGLARGRILLFLHADTRLPPGFPTLIEASLRDPSIFAGAFSLAIDQAGPALRAIAHCANLRSCLFQLPYGDQAIFIRRDDFLSLGGFPEAPIMEDFIFIRKARRKGRIVTLPQHATTSARRWRRLGIVRTTLVNQLIVLGYYAGIPLSKLASLYRR